MMMKYYILIFALWLLSAVGVHAQDEQEDDPKLTISGQLIDADLKEPMVQATIQLFTASAWWLRRVVPTS